MTATKTQDVKATVAQAKALAKAGAAIVRIAVDTQADAEAIAEIRKKTPGINLSVDLQENFRLAEAVAPFVDKIRYNPGHLHHVWKGKTIREKVAWITRLAAKHNIALRIGVNGGSLAPDLLEKHQGDHVAAMVECASTHSGWLDEDAFLNYCVSLKDSDPVKVVQANRGFAEMRPDVPLHLGVTEAGLPPDGVIKTRIAFEQLLPLGIGDTIRVSLTLPNAKKAEEVGYAKEILQDIFKGRFRSVPPKFGEGLNIISCPSCSRVENEAFVELAEKVKAMTEYASAHSLTVAVMGCRVNGPGETDDADLGLWCGPTNVTLKKKADKIGAFSYEEVLPKLKEELDKLISRKG